MVDGLLERRRLRGFGGLTVADVITVAEERAGMLVLVTVVTLASLLPLAIDTQVDGWRGRGPRPQGPRPARPRRVQRIFREIMTLLIALEFNHSLQYVIADERSIVQAKVVS